MQKIRWTLVSQLYCEILLPSIIIYWYWKVSWNPEHSWYWQSYLPVLFEALHNNTTNERTIQSKKRAEMAHEICLDSTKTAGFSTHMSMVSFQPSIVHSAISINGNWLERHLCKKNSHVIAISVWSLQSSNLTVYNLLSAGMISHLGSNGWTSTLIHKTSKREQVDRSGNATKREDLRCCTVDGSLRTTRPHAKNENPFNNNNNKARDYSRTSWSDGLRL